MSLTDQIAKILGYQDRIEASIKQIADAQAESGKFSAQVAELTGRVSKLDADLVASNTALSAASTTNAEQAARISELESKVADESKRANEVIASQSLDPGKLPAVSPAATSIASKPQTITEKCLAANQKSILK